MPAGISSFRMHRIEKFHEKKSIWARVSLENDSEKMKICNIDIIDEDVLILSAKGFRFAKFLG